MLPVQTVMIRYMVLVYRWGRGRSDAVSVWGGSVTGGCARGGGVLGRRTRGGCEKAPPVWDRRGLRIREIADLFFEGLYFVY